MKRNVLRRAPLCALMGIVYLTGCGRTGSVDLPLPQGEIQTTSAYHAVVQIVAPNGAGMCSGTFISPRAVLTAAHCTQANGAYRITGFYGTFTTSSKLSFGPGLIDDPNDIAILYFDRNVVQGDDAIADVSAEINSGDTIRIVGYGCNNISTRSGAGVKRTGTNVVYDINDYIELLTPQSGTSPRGILGASNRAGSCFGDSGGFLGKVQSNGKMSVMGVTHAGGSYQDMLISQFAHVGRSDNLGFLSAANSQLNLGIGGL